MCNVQKEMASYPLLLSLVIRYLDIVGLICGFYKVRAQDAPSLKLHSGAPHYWIRVNKFEDKSWYFIRKT